MLSNNNLFERKVDTSNADLFDEPANSNKIYNKYSDITLTEIGEGETVIVLNDDGKNLKGKYTKINGVLVFEQSSGTSGGKDGKDGRDGTNGTDGTNGVGVPVGGTTGQVLCKKSDADYDTEWKTVAISTVSNPATWIEDFISIYFGWLISNPFQSFVFEFTTSDIITV